MRSIQISHGRTCATILDYGATLARLQVPVGRDSRNVVLSLAHLTDYPKHAAYFGAIAGRCANRIANGTAVLDGRLHRLTLNENGVTHLHGGTTGFSSQIWSIENAEKECVSLLLHSPDGDNGYPGNLQVRCCYNLVDENTLQIELTAKTDAMTIVNLATHSYFNLGLDDNILGHTLHIPSSRVCSVDDRHIPTGEIIDAVGTGFDFKKPASIGRRRAATAGGFDINNAIYEEPSTDPRLLAGLTAPDGVLHLDILSTEPGLQFYDGQYLPLAVEVDGGRNVKFGGCCLEPQRYPDAIHHPHFPSTALSPGETYRQQTIYSFQR